MMLPAGLTLVVKPKTGGVEAYHVPVKAGQYHPLSFFFSVHLSREIGLNFVASLGLGMGCMSATFHVGGT